MSPQSALEPFEEEIIANVRDFGCHINYVADPSGEPPIFGYSVGFLETVGQPEVIIFGLSSKMTAFMINELLRRCREGLQLEDRTQVDELLVDHICVARTVCSRFIVPEYLNSAIWYHRHRTGEQLDRVAQLVWPGAIDGLFPWDPGCDPIVVDNQPALYEKGLNS
jgi:hypothetical protein